MSDVVRCPDCGHESPAGSASCTHCNYPLQPGEPPAAPPPIEPAIVVPRPVRRPRPGPAVNATTLNLWLLMGVVAALALIWTAYTSFRKNNAVPVEGATADQQRLADSLRTVIARDSTNVEAGIEYANLLYDTANWKEAASYYTRAIARDSSRVSAIVDLGVCYYNQGDMSRATDLFLLALRRAPGHPVALFNLGIVNERAGQDEAALRYFHQSLESNPSEEMRQQIVQRMQRILQKTGRKAPPLGAGGLPGGGSAPAPSPGGPGR